MTDAGIYAVVNRLLDFKTKGEAEAYIETDAGADYKTFARALLARIFFARTTNQNALLHQWFAQIANQGNADAKMVKGQCHHEWALDIRLRDEQFAWIWERTGALLSYEKQCSLLASETLGVSSRMSTKELKEYMDQIQRHYAGRGVHLTQPKDKAA